MIFSSPTLDCVLRSVCKKYSKKKAVIFNNESITYRQILSYSMNLANSLADLGIHKGDKVAIILPNCFEYLYVYFACFFLGAWATPMSTRWEREELKNVLTDSDSKMVIYQDRIGVFNYNKILASLRYEIPLCEYFVCKGKGLIEGAIHLSSLIHTSTSIEWQPVQSERIEADDVAILAYTSGTTGKPKGVMIPHNTLVTTSYHTGKLWGFEGDTSFSVAPLYAAQGFLAVLIDLVSGVTMKWIENFNPNDILSEIAKKDLHVFHTQPTMWSILLSQPYFDHIDFSHLKKVIVSGSLCSYELAKRIEERTGCTLLNAYGLIEATGVVTITRLDDPKEVRFGTVGQPIDGVEIKITDKERKEVPVGETGELAVRGYVMKGYYKNPEKTAEVIDGDGWLYTGDLAQMHEDGLNIKIVGRCKDMVIRGAFNIYPIDIEECIVQNEQVEDVSVVGRPDEILGESLIAFVIPTVDATISPGDIKRFCRGRIANYKVPDEVHFVSQFPILLSGKIQKNVLREWAEHGIPLECMILFDDKTLSEVSLEKQF
ncbi:MAG: class I adenylate-forming enzyme family protein [bacterium]